MWAARRGSRAECACGLFLSYLEPAVWPRGITAHWSLGGISVADGEHWLNSSTARVTAYGLWGAPWVQGGRRQLAIRLRTASVYWASAEGPISPLSSHPRHHIHVRPTATDYQVVIASNAYFHLSPFKNNL